MEASPESIFNRQVSWYRSMTKCIEPPTLIYHKGEWKIRVPETWPEEIVREMCRWKVGNWESYHTIQHDSVE